jgi:hypothetical protein
MADRELTLDKGDLMEWLAEPELRPDRRMTLGDKLEINNILVNCRGWIGEAPFALDPEKAAKTLNDADDTWEKAARPEFANRFVFTTFGVNSLGGIVSPQGLGLELVFREDSPELNRGQRIQINSVFPSALFQVYSESSTQGESKFNGVFEAELEPPGNLIKAAKSATGIEDFVKVGGSLALEASYSHNRKINWSTKSYSSVVEAIGVGDVRASWVFHKSHGPLTGKIFETVTGLTLSRRKNSIAYNARMFIIFKVGPFPIRKYSEWVNLSANW